MKSVISIICLFISLSVIHAQDITKLNIQFGNNSETGKYISLDNSKIYFEEYGNKNNPPLVLVHGNGGSIRAMEKQILYFMNDFHIIVADNRTHGKSGNSEHLTYEQITNDYAAILDYLKLDSVNILGQSDGGIIGLLFAINYPNKVNRLISAVPNIRPGKEAIADWELELSKNYRALIDSMIAAGNKDRDWKNEKVHMELMATEPNIPHSDLNKIECPVLIITSDDDIIKPRHILEIFEQIPNAQLFVMPGATHFMIRDEHELFNYMSERFLKSEFKRPKSKDVLMKLIGLE